MHGEIADVAAEYDLALVLQFRGDSVPALDDRPSRLEQPLSRRVGDRRRCVKLTYDAVELLAQRIGVSPTLGPVEHIFGGSVRLTPNGPRGRIRGDPLLPHHSGEVLPPLPQHGLIDVETPSVDALGLDDQVHV